VRTSSVIAVNVRNDGSAPRSSVHAEIRVMIFELPDGEKAPGPEPAAK
jgi:hypothetical protein